MIISSFKNTFFIKFYKSLINSDFLVNLKDSLEKEYGKYKIDGIILLKSLEINDLVNNKLFLRASYDLYNIDLTKAEVSGNGLACLAKYINYNLKFDKFFKNIEFSFYSVSFNRVFNLKYKEKFYFVGFDSSKFEFKQSVLNECYYVNVGNPHVICINNNLSFNKKSLVTDFLKNLYQEVSRVLGFESNVHLILKKSNNFYIYSYERGVGFSKSCGSGSVASFYLLNKLKVIKANENEIILKSPGGDIKILKENDIYYLVSCPVILDKVNL